MANFEQAFDNTMKWEDSTRSGKVTVDAGGRTRFGIAQKFHPNLPESFFACPAEEALAQAEDIYRREYWTPLRLDEVKSQAVANKLFDMAVNMGLVQAAIFAQRAVNYLLKADSPSMAKVEVDGVIGRQTLARIDFEDEQKIVSELRAWSKAHYLDIVDRNPEEAVYLAGWLKRAAA